MTQFNWIESDVLVSNIETKLTYAYQPYSGQFCQVTWIGFDEDFQTFRYQVDYTFFQRFETVEEWHATGFTFKDIYCQLRGWSVISETVQAEDSEDSEDSEDGTVLCQVCFERFDESDTEVFDGQTECHDCLTDHTVCCERCDERLESDYAVSFDSSVYCEDCADRVSSVCNDCDERTNSDDATQDHRGNTICQHCYDRGGYFYCEGCHETCAEDYYGRDGYCQGCAEQDEDDEESSDLIKSYGYRPYVQFFDKANKILQGAKKGFPLYGIELEVNTKEREEHASYTVDALGEDHAYLKEDSSIGGGFEIVTQPHTFEAHKELWGEFFDAVPHGMTSYKSGNCGMHVHISRSALSQMQIRKMLVFMNAPENLGYISGIAQRSNNSYCKIAKKELTGRLSYDRYEALNVTNRATVEVRIFRGTVRRDRFFKNLEFVDAMVKFCAVSNYTELTASNFIAYVAKHRSSYKNLYNFHIEKSYATGKPLPISNDRQMALVADIAA